MLRDLGRKAFATQLLRRALALPQRALLFHAKVQCVDQVRVRSWSTYSLRCCSVRDRHLEQERMGGFPLEGEDCLLLRSTQEASLAASRLRAPHGTGELGLTML